MNQKIISALVYLHSLLEEADVDHLTISMSADSTNVLASRIFGTRGDESISMVMNDYPVNPIQDMITHINEEMCTDCVKIDYLYNDAYFKSLSKAYVDSLVNEFGTNVAIPVELAKAIIKHHISDHFVKVKAKTKQGTSVWNYVDDLSALDLIVDKMDGVSTWLVANKEVEDVLES